MPTPMMQQYEEAKARHPGMLLLFRMGDFYETFGSDAENASRLLGLTLTSRDKTMAMAGFPHHQLEAYLRKLLASGCRVAICDQVEDPALAKGLVKREVTRVVTPGTITEDNLLDPHQANHLVCLSCGDKDSAALAWLELSTGKFCAADIPWDRLLDEVSRIGPTECIFADEHADKVRDLLEKGFPRLTLTPQPAWLFDGATARNALHKHFKTSTLAGFGFDSEPPCLAAAGALLQYVQETLKAGLDHIRRLEPYCNDRYLILDQSTRRSLELTRTLREGHRQGSLLAALDRTVTAMGSRLLHDWLVAPLTDRTDIESRLDAVEEISKDNSLRSETRARLQETLDLARLTSRVSTGRATPRDLAGIARTLGKLPEVKAKITARKAQLLRDLEAKLELCPELRTALDSALGDEPPVSPKEGGIIRARYDADLDELRQIARGGKEWIARFQAQEVARTGINSLKVGFNKVFGYYIEITHTHAAKIPDGYQRKQTLKNAERYITPELKEYEEKVLTAEEKSNQREYELFLILRDRVAEQTGRLMQTAEILAQLDVLTALAELAVTQGYTRPKFEDDPLLHIVDGRHPVLEQTLQRGTFVPNDVKLGPDEGLLWLITGPNMSGKSTFIRQVALLTLMAQMGSFVPASEARLGVADRIFTRVGASDELSRGQSTFMVEMTEAANILNNATERSLVILDEIGRGTSTYDGVSLAWAITEHLHSQIGCRALFATHYHELAQLAETLPGLRNYNVLVREAEEDIVFLHKITAGSANKSYGIHVARLAGVPGEVIERARDVLAELEAHHLDKRLPTPPPRKRRRTTADSQPSLFADVSEQA